MLCLRQILNVNWWDFILNEKVLAQASLPSMCGLLVQRNLRWIEHVQQRENARLPKQKLYLQLIEVSRGIDRP